MSILAKMTDQFNQLPADVQLQVMDFVDFLAQRYEVQESLKLTSDERRSLEKSLGISPKSDYKTKREAVLIS